MQLPDTPHTIAGSTDVQYRSRSTDNIEESAVMYTHVR